MPYAISAIAPAGPGRAEPNSGCLLGHPGIVDTVTARRVMRSAPWASRVLAALITLVAVLPLLARLPRVAVVACFDAGHPLYTLTETHAGIAANCVTAPAPVVTWTLMVAATLLVHALLLPAALLAAGLLLRGARHLVDSGRRLLAVVLGRLRAIVVVSWPAAPVLVPVTVTRPAYGRTNPRRGPPLS